MSDGGPIDALEQALALRAAPGRASMLRKRPLPDNVLLLIRIVAGDRNRLEGAARRTGETANAVLEAAQLYLQQILLSDDGDPYRVLGVPADASDDTIKAHYRSLMVWLHPDRDPDRWETGFADRVNGAWRAVGSAARRAQHDEQRRVELASAQNAQGAASVARSRTTVIDLRESRPPRARPNLGWVPFAGLGALVVLAALVIGVAYELRTQTPVADADHRSSPADQASDASSEPMNTVASTSARSPAVGSVTAVAQPPPSTDESMQAQFGPDSGAGDRVQAITQHASVVAPTSAAVPGPVAPGLSEREVGAARVSVGPNPDARPQSSVAIAGAERSRAQAALFRSPRGVGDAGGLDASRAGLAGATRVARDQRIAPDQVAVRDPQRGPMVGRVADAPAAPAGPAAPEQPAPSVSPKEGAAALSAAFVSAYTDGNLPRLMRLFTPTAVNGHGGIEAIAADYAEFFVSSRSRSLRWQPVSWDLRPDRIVGVGPFDARIVRKGDLFAYEVRGWMRIEAVPVGGVWKIQRIQHGNSQ